ncbi:hypothetical protein C2S51_002939 [Perilla frutescens var. frutescens]|nr:hypothetical protein C2S51_002939 [Perilla frutescens var. frutescens]
MEKIQKKANKNTKNKKKQPLRVVYITNPMKFKTSASEFRALVQELTGQDAGTAYSSATFSAEDAGGEAEKVAAEDNVHAELDEEEVTELGRPSGGVGEPDPSPADDGSDDDGFVSSLMIESFQGLGSNLVDVLKSLDAM